MSVSAVVLGSRVTSIVSLTAEPSHVYGVDVNGAVLGVEAAPEIPPALACHEAELTPFWPSVVSSSENA